MIRDLASLPSVPRRLIDRLEELTELVRRLAEAEPRRDRKLDEIQRQMGRTANNAEQIPAALEELKQARTALERIEGRVKGMEADLDRLETVIADVAPRLPPNKNSGPIARARNALSGG